jgi:hypothetical protein
MRSLPIAASVEGPALIVAWDAIGLDETCDAMPIQTMNIDAVSAVATIFRCVVVFAWQMEEFMLRSQPDHSVVCMRYLRSLRFELDQLGNRLLLAANSLRRPAHTSAFRVMSRATDAGLPSPLAAERQFQHSLRHKRQQSLLI